MVSRGSRHQWAPAVVVSIHGSQRPAGDGELLDRHARIARDRRPPLRTAPVPPEKIPMTRSQKVTLLQCVESYFADHLRRVRGASRHTTRTYAQALRLFFVFLADRLRRPIGGLGLDDIQADAVLAFLDHIEGARHNSPATRNCRRAAIRGFAAHLLRHDITRAAQYERILAIP